MKKKTELERPRASKKKAKRATELERKSEAERRKQGEAMLQSVYAWMGWDGINIAYHTSIRFTHKGGQG